MVPPTLLIASDGNKILGYHTPTHIAFESKSSFIGRSRHREGVFQGADGGFDAGPPAQPAAEPAPLLLLGPLRREPSPRRQRHLLHSQGFCLALVLRGEKSAVTGGHLRGSPEVGLMLLQRRHPRRGIGRIAGENLVAAHHAVFHLVDPHQPTKLVGLMGFAFADDFRVGLEQTQHFVLHGAVPLHHSFLGLPDYVLHQGEKVPQLANLGYYSPDFAHHFQPSLPPALHHFAGLSHHSSSQSQQLLVTVAHPLLVGFGEGLGRTTDFQQTMFHRACVMDHFHGSGLTLVGDAFEAATEHPDAVAQNRTVGRVVNVAFHNRSVGPNFFALGYALLAGQADHALMNLGGDGRTEQGQAAAETVNSGVMSASKWVKRRYTRLLRSSRSRSRKLQPFRCFMTQQRSRRSGAMPRRPVRVERGLRLARHWRTKSTKAGSSKSRSTGSSRSSLSRAICWAKGE